MSDRASDITDLSEIPPSTTTISTVAVQAGRSKVVLAILRCGEWIRVRVHQMEPDLMEVGSTLEEALQLQAEHDQLLSKLQAKEEEIKQLLSRADSYAGDNRSEQAVYSAMSDTLAEAWRDLNDKLNYRRQLLSESVNFHQIAQSFSSQMENAQSRFVSLPFATDVESARRQLHQHAEIKQEILEASKSTLDLGHSLLERIKEMGMHAELTNRHATTSACYGIEHLLELLQDRRRRLEELWEQRRIRLEQSLHLFQLDQEVNKVLGWYRTTGHAQLQRTELGDSYESARFVQEDHQRFEQQARDIQENVLRLVRNADQLLRRTQIDAEGVRSRLLEVDTECENFMIKLDTRRKNISMAISFFELAETALNKLSEIEVQLNSSDLPRNSTELAERHSQMSNIIVEVSTVAQTEGRLLLERVSRDDQGAEGVRRRMQLLQDRCADLESLCKARRAEAWEMSQTYLHFQETYTSLYTWMTQIVQTKLTRHADMGSSLEAAKDFLQVHEQLEKDIKDKSADLQALAEAASSLVKSGDQEAKSAVEKASMLQEQVTRVHRVTEVRITLSIIYVSFLSRVQQNANYMRDLEHILRSETENLQDLTDSAVQQTEELWNEVESSFHDLEDKGREFLKSSSTITEDSSLQIRRSIGNVESILSESRDHMTFLTTQWESWQTHVSTSRQFKTQWHQFIQDARKSIDRVTKLENDFFPMLAGELGSSIEAANEYQHRLDNFMPQFEEAQAELEEHLKSAEMLSLKGDTRGQNEQITNELIKVHQRFQARIHEYQILLKMTIQFFKNLDQLDKLIERTEKEYSESQLPVDLNRAETMLEEHKKKKQEISHLINYTADEGEKIVVRVRQTDAEAVAKDDVQKVLTAADDYKRRWNTTWEEQERRLRQNLQICQFNFDLRQIHSEIDELHQHLQARRGSYGNSLPAAKMTSQAFKQFEMTVQLIEEKINKFTTTAELMVQDEHYDSVHIRREIDMLNTKWTTFHTSVRDYRDMLEISIDYYRLMEETEHWMTEGNNFLINLGQRANQIHTPEEAEELSKRINKYVEEEKPLQDERMKQLSELAVQLYGEEGPSRVHNLYVQYQDLIQGFQQADNEISRLQKTLETPTPVMEEFTPMEVTVTAQAPTKEDKPPRITQHIKNAEVMEGTKVVFECHIESETAFEVKWHKDAMPLNSPDYETRLEGNIATLTIEETFSEDTARYTVKVWNTYGEVESSAYLHVKETHQQIIPPDFTKNLKSMDALEGNGFVFECHVMGIPSPTISWYKDEINIDNSPEYVITKINGTCCLKIKKVTTEHSARYTCRANNPGGEASSSARLTVIPAQTPVIQQPLRDMSAAEGKPIKLEIVFSASPTPQVTWYRSQKEIMPSYMFKITTETTRSVLEVTKAYPEDSGEYSVIIRNPLGEARSSCTITIESFYSSTAPRVQPEEMSVGSIEEPMAPTFTQPLAPSREVMEGSRVRLECVLVGHPEPEVIWFHNDKPVKESTDIQLLFEGDRCTLAIREAYLEDAGHYRVSAKNNLGEAESACRLHVEPLSELSDASVGGEISAPKFTQLLRDINAQQGQRVTLQCRVQGHPMPNVNWFKDNRPIEPSEDFQVTAFADVHNLTIPEVFVEDGGQYMVKANNKAGEAKCYSKLSVRPAVPMEEVMMKSVETRRTLTEVTHSPPEFVRLFQDKVVRPGDAVTLDCIITGNPKPKTTWFFNGEPVVSQDYQISNEGNKYSLYIPEVFDEDAGRFSVTAENPSGKATCSAMMYVEEPVQEQKMPIVETRTFESQMGKRFSSTETLTTTETRTRRTIMEMRPDGTYIPSIEGHSTTLVTDVPPKFEVQAGMIPSQEHYATTVTTDMQPKYQPVDLTISVPIPPKFLQALKNITTMEGTRVTFDGVVTGKPEPTIKWFKEGRDLSDGPDFEISYREGRVSLTIPQTFPEDTGKYTCKASNIAGSATSTTELIVRASVIPPSFTEKFYDIAVKEGQPVKLTVRVAGSPNPEVTWYRNGSQIVSSPDFEIVQEGDIHSLYIPEVFYEDSAKYTVQALNQGGRTQVSANLTVDGAPLPIPKAEGEVEAEEQKPVSEARELFEPSRAPGTRAAPKWAPEEAPKPKVAKFEKPVEPYKPEKFRQEVAMEVDEKQVLPEFKKRIPLFGIPVDVPEPEKKVSSQAEMRLPRFGVPIDEAPVTSKPTSLYQKEKPRFTKPLRDQTVKEGQKVRLDVNFKGQPEPIVKWFREEAEIQSSADFEISYSNEATSLTIPEVFPEDAGQFTCIITNADGSATSEASLRVMPSQKPVTEVFEPTVAPPRAERMPSPIEAVKPMFIERLQNSRLVEDTNVILECHVSGQPFPEVFWSKDGIPIRPDSRHKISVDQGTGRCTLIISRCNPDDAGEYACTARNPVGQTITAASLLPVEKKEPPPPLPKSMPPVIPFQQEVLEKAQQPRRVEKDFFIPRSNRILESNIDYRMAQPEEPEYQPVAEDEQQFQVSHFEDRLREEIQYRDGKVRFASETETSEYDSEVPDAFAPNGPPQIIIKIKNFHLVEGADATFICRIVGKPRPKVAWYKDGHRIKRSSRYEIKYDREGFCTLRIRVALPEDAGHYTVLAVNSMGKDTCSSQLLVDGTAQIDATSFVHPETLDRILRRDAARASTEMPQDQSGVFESQLKPQFKMRPEDKQVREGQTIRFDTLVTGRPAPELTWYCNDQEVHPDDHHKIVVNEDGVHSLIISKASPLDAGIYRCVATNKGGENTFTVHLTVLEREQIQPPKFVERMNNYTIKEGQSIMLTARAVGTPTPMMSWQKNNKMLTPQKDYRIEIDNGRSTLYIEDAKKVDSAWFQCTAVNVAGTASCRAKLVVEPDFAKKIEAAPKFAPPAPVKRDQVRKVEAAPPQYEKPQERTYEKPQERTPSPKYEIQSEGPVQEITYVKDGDRAILRLVREDDLSRMPYQKLEKPEPMAVPMEVESEEETKIPSMTEARARFDQPDTVPPKKVSKIEIKPTAPPMAPVKAPPKPILEWVPKKVEPPVHKPVPPPPKQPDQPIFVSTKKKSPSPSYELQEEGPVQQISYVSDTERGYCRVISEDELDFPRREEKTRGAPPPKVPITEEEEPVAKKPVAAPPTAPKPKKKAPPQVVHFTPEFPVTPAAAKPTKAKTELKVPPKVQPKPKKPKERSPESHYEIQEEGYVQEIHYVSENEMGSLRLVSYSADEDSTRLDDTYPKVEPTIPPSLETKYKLFRPQKPPSPKERRRTRKTPSPPKERAERPKTQVPQYLPPTIPMVVLDVTKKRDVDHESAVREYIRREGEAPAPEDLYSKSKQLPPKFRTQIKPMVHLKENEPLHFECKLVPIGDPNMKVEWFKDGQPLQHGHRFKPAHEFGFVSLDILYMLPENSGVYTCVATNLYGEDRTESEVICRGRISVIIDTQLPGEGAIHIQEMEEAWRGQAKLEEMEIEEPKQRFPPVVDLKPEPIEVQENEPAKFMVKVRGYPRPRVNWFVNGCLIVSGTRHKVTYDGMMHYLEIPRVRETDTGQVRIVVRNSEGEAEVSTDLKVIPRDDWRSQLRQAPKGEVTIELDRRKKIELKAPPKSTEYEIKQLERVGDKEISIKQFDRQTVITEQQYITTHRELRPVKPESHELPSRVIRQDRPEIQLEIQQARMVPVMPQAVQPERGEPMVSEHQVLLERREPPVFTKPLRPARITEGKPVTLDVSFKGYPPPLITWYRDNFEIRPSHDFQITTTETTSKLFIPEVFPEDTGMVTVKAYNMYGMVQCKAKLTVVEEEEPSREMPPEFRNLIRDNQVVEHEPATFDCQVIGHPKPKVHWEKDGKPMEENPRMKFIHEDENFTLLIYEVNPHDAGTYACVAINNVGKATCTAKLIVEVPVGPPETMEPQYAEPPTSAPECIQPPQSLVTDEGEPVTFTTRIKGSPAPTVTWYRNNQLIKPSKYFHMESTPDGVHSLSILEAFPEDTGHYKCVARNKTGEITVTCYLKVHALESEPEHMPAKPQEKPPQIVKPITNTLVVEGSPAKFVAEYSGEPQPQVTWVRNALQTMQETRNVKIETTKTSTTLTIKQVFPEDSGLITCRLKNKLGMTECSAELYVQDVEQAKLLEERYKTTIERMPPEFVKPLPAIQEITPGQQTRLEATVAAQPPPKKYTWTVNGQEVRPTERIRIVRENNTIILIINPTQPQDVGEYILRVENEIGEVTCRTTLILPGKEKIIQLPKPRKPEDMSLTHTTVTTTREQVVTTRNIQPELIHPMEPEVYVRERGIVRLECEIDAYTPPMVNWFVNGVEIKRSPHYDISYEDGKSVLLIIEVGPEDTGEYTVKAKSDEIGEIVSSTTLYVQEPATEEMAPTQQPDSAEIQPSPAAELMMPPNFIEPVQSMEAKDGQELRLPCKVTGKPMPQISWYHNGKNIDQDEEYVVTYNPDTGDISLLIVEVFPEDEGEYVCVAHNPAGDAVTRANLRVLEPAVPEQVVVVEETQVKEVPDTECVPEAGMEVEEGEVKPEVIDRPKVVALVDTQKARSPSPIEEITPAAPAEPEEVLPEIMEETVKPKTKVVKEEPKPTEEPVETTEEDVKPDVIERPKVEPLEKERPRSPSPMEIVEETPAAPEEPVEELPEVEEESVAPTKIEKAEITVEFKPEEVAEEDVKPDVIDRPKKVPLEEEKPRSPSPELMEPVTMPEEPVVEEEVPEVEEEVVEHGVKPTKIDRPTPKSIIEEEVPEEPAFTEEVQAPVEEKPEELPEQVSEEQVVPDAITKKPELPSLDEKVDKKATTVGEEAPKPKEEIIVEDVYEPIEEGQVIEEVPPEFVELLQPQMVMDGDRVVLICKVIGNPAPSITWYRNGTELTPSSDFQPGFDTPTGVSSLVIPEVFPEDAGEYACRAVNPFGEAVTTANLMVEVAADEPEELPMEQSPVPEDVPDAPAEVREMPPEQRAPEFLKPLVTSMELPEGSVAKFVTEVTGEPKPTVTWYVNETPLEPSPRVQIMLEDNVCTLIIFSVMPQDTGSYTCEARNVVGVTTCKTTLHITPKKTMEVELTPQPERIVYTEEETQVKRPMFESDTYFTSEDEIPEDQLMAPEFTQLLKPQTVKDGDRVELIVHFKGRPSPRIRWFHNGQEVVKSPDFEITIDYDKGVSVLIIIEVYPEDEGEYTCVASNKLGETITTCRLTIIGPDEEIPTAETHRETIEIQHQKPEQQVPEKTTVTTTIQLQEQPKPEDSMVIPEETTHTQAIRIDKPQEVVVTEQQVVQLEQQPQQPTQAQTVEIRVGMPQTPTTPLTTVQRVTETTTITTVSSQIQPEEMSEIKEGKETRTTTIVFDEKSGPEPGIVVMEVPETPVVTDVTSGSETTTTTVTKELRFQEVEAPEVPESHKETIEIVRESPPQEVELHVQVPKTTTETTVVSMETQQTVQSTQRIEVEIQEAVMQQKPVQTEIVMPQKRTSVTEIQMKAAAPQVVEVPRPVDEQVEETRPVIEKVTKEMPEQTHKEEIGFEIKPEPVSQKITFEVDVKPQEQEEVVPVESETPAPFHPEEVTEREVITIKPTPELETKAPEDEITVTERETIEIVKVPEDKTTSLEIQVTSTAPTVTETVQVDTITQKTVTQIVPVVEETHKDEITLDISGKPLEEVQLTIQKPTEKQVPETEEVKEEEKVTETVTETFQVPEVEEAPQKEEPVETEEKPMEEVTMTIDVQERETTEIEEVTTTESTEVELVPTVTVPSVTETHKEEISIDTQEKPKEQVTMVIQMPEQKDVPETKQTIQIETIEVTKKTTEEVPEVKEKPKEETTITTEEKPQEGVQFQIEIKQQEVPETTEVTTTETTVKTVTQVIEVPTVEETHKEEVTFDISKKPEVVQMEIDVPEQVTQTVTVETKMTEEVQEVPEKPEVTESHKEEITFDIKGKPTQFAEMAIKIPVEKTETSPKEVSPKEVSPLLAPTTEEIFEDFETVEEGSPEFTWGLTSLKVMDGEEAKFMCEVKSEETPDITWFHDEKIVTENQDFRISFEPETGKCTLLIVEVFPQDAGEYLCVAVNEIGKAVTKATLEVESYEYVSTEELSDSIVSSQEAASDTEVSAARKQMLDEMEEMQDRIHTLFSGVRDELDADLEKSEQVREEILRTSLHEDQLKEEELSEFSSASPVVTSPGEEEDKPEEVPTSEMPKFKTDETVEETVHEIVTEVQPQIEESTTKPGEIIIEMIQPEAKQPEEFKVETAVEVPEQQETVEVPETTTVTTTTSEVVIDFTKPDKKVPETSKIDIEVESIEKPEVLEVSETPSETVTTTEVVMQISKPEPGKPEETKVEFVEESTEKPQVTEVEQTVVEITQPSEVISEVAKPEPEKPEVSKVEMVIETTEAPKVDEVTETTTETTKTTQVVIDIAKPKPEETPVSKVEMVIETTETPEVIEVKETPSETSTKTEITMDVKKVEPAAPGVSQVELVVGTEEVPEVTEVTETTTETTTKTEVSIEVAKPEPAVQEVSKVEIVTETAEVPQVTEVTETPSETTTTSETIVEIVKPEPKSTEVSKVEMVIETTDAPEITEVTETTTETTSTSEVSLEILDTEKVKPETSKVEITLGTTEVPDVIEVAEVPAETTTTTETEQEEAKAVPEKPEISKVDTVDETTPTQDVVEVSETPTETTTTSEVIIDITKPDSAKPDMSEVEMVIETTEAPEVTEVTETPSETTTMSEISIDIGKVEPEKPEVSKVEMVIESTETPDVSEVTETTTTTTTTSEVSIDVSKPEEAETKPSKVDTVEETIVAPEVTEVSEVPTEETTPSEVTVEVAESLPAKPEEAKVDLVVEATEVSEAAEVSEVPEETPKHTEETADLAKPEQTVPDESKTDIAVEVTETPDVVETADLPVETTTPSEEAESVAKSEVAPKEESKVDTDVEAIETPETQEVKELEPETVSPTEVTTEADKPEEAKPEESKIDTAVEIAEVPEVTDVTDVTEETSTQSEVIVEVAKTDETKPETSETSAIEEVIDIPAVTEVSEVQAETPAPSEVTVEVASSTPQESEVTKIDSVTEITETPEVVELTVAPSETTSPSEVPSDVGKTEPKQPVESQIDIQVEETVPADVTQVEEIPEETTTPSDVTVDVVKSQTDLPEETKIDTAEETTETVELTPVSELLPEEQTPSEVTQEVAKPEVAKPEESKIDVAVEEVEQPAVTDVKEDVPETLQSSEITVEVGKPEAKQPEEYKVDIVQEVVDQPEVTEVTTVTQEQTEISEVSVEVAKPETQTPGEYKIDLVQEEVEQPEVSDVVEEKPVEGTVTEVKVEIGEAKPETVEQLEAEDKEEHVETFKEEVTVQKEPEEPETDVVTVTFGMHEGEDEETITHEILEETKEVAEVEVERPIFVLPLRDETLPEGHDLRMETIVQGKPAPTVQWFVDDEQISPSEDIEILYEEGKCVLVIREVFVEDEGEYWVEAVNEYGTATTSAYVSVLPVEEKPEEDMTVKEKTTIKTTETVEVTIEDKPEEVPQKEVSEETVLSIKPEEVSEGVFEAPRFTTTLQKHVDVQEGTTITLTCVVTGNPRPEVVWFMDDEPLPTDERFVTEYHRETVTLTIHNTTIDDEAYYKCVATNPHGSATTVVELFVQAVPMFKVLKEEFYKIEVVIDLYWKNKQMLKIEENITETKTITDHRNSL